MGAAEAFGIKHEDRVYITMPVYHSAAGREGLSISGRGLDKGAEPK